MLDAEHLELNNQAMGLTDNGHRQLAEKVGMPWDYYERTAAVAGLREYNVNAWAQAKRDEKKLFRTLDGNVRAVLGKNFKPMDNFMLLDAVVPALKQLDPGQLMMRTYALTERHLYLQVVFPGTETALVQPDRHERIEKPITVMAGITIRNSEVGAAALDIRKTVWNLVCWNGLITESVLRKFHLGRELEGDDGNGGGDIWREDTLAKEMELIRLRARDIVGEAMDPRGLEGFVEKAQHAMEDKVGEDRDALVVNVTKRLALTQEEAKGAVENMLLGGPDNLNRWGFANGVNALVHKLDNPDRQYELERTAAEIIDLKPSEWRVLAN